MTQIDDGEEDQVPYEPDPAKRAIQFEIRWADIRNEMDELAVETGTQSFVTIVDEHGKRHFHKTPGYTGDVRADYAVARDKELFKDINFNGTEDKKDKKQGRGETDTGKAG